MRDILSERSWESMDAQNFAGMDRLKAIPVWIWLRG